MIVADEFHIQLLQSIWLCSDCYEVLVMWSIGIITTLCWCILVSWLSAWPVSCLWCSFKNIFRVYARCFQLLFGPFILFCSRFCICYSTLLLLHHILAIIVECSSLFVLSIALLVNLVSCDWCLRALTMFISQLFEVKSCWSLLIMATAFLFIVCLLNHYLLICD